MRALKSRCKNSMFWLIFIFNYDTFLFINDTIFQEVIEKQTDSYIPVWGKEKKESRPLKLERTAGEKDKRNVPYLTNVVAANSFPMARIPFCMRNTCASEIYCPRRYWRINVSLIPTY